MDHYTPTRHTHSHTPLQAPPLLHKQFTFYSDDDNKNWIFKRGHSELKITLQDTSFYHIK